MVNPTPKYLFYLDSELIAASPFQSWKGLCQHLDIPPNQPVINSTDAHTQDLITQLQPTNPLPLIVIGSDRTFHQLINEIQDSFPKLLYGILPLGWPRHLAQYFGITSPSQAWQRLQQPQSKKIDLIETSIAAHHYVISTISWGLEGQIAQALASVPSPTLVNRILAQIKTLLTAPAYRFYLDIDLDTQVIDTHQLSLHNFPSTHYQAANPQDGLLTLEVAHSKASLLSQRLAGAVIKPRRLNMDDPNHQLQTISMQTQAPLCLDGLFVPPQTEIIELGILAEAIEFLY